MATSTTQIANLALSRIGGQLIASLDESTTEEARQCRLHFDQKRDALLRRHQWSFATRRTSLSAVADAPSTEWGAAWTLPADCVRLIRVVGTHILVPNENFAIEGRQLLTDEETSISIVYVSNGIPVTEWDSLFVDALVCLLAAELAGSIAQSPAQKADLLQEYQRLALPDAQTADAREVKSAENHGWRNISARSPLVNGRFARRGGLPSHITVTGSEQIDSASDLDAIFEAEL